MKDTSETLNIIENFNKFGDIGIDTETFFMMSSSGQTYTVFKNVEFYMSAARVSGLQFD